MIAMMELPMRIDGKRKIWWTVAMMTLIAWTSSSVMGHAMLVRSQPAAKAALKEPPKNVQLWFSEELESQFSSIVVTDQNGNRVDKNDTSPGDNKKSLQVSLENLVGGTYTVEWKALATDQHMMKGKFTFTVAASTAAGTQTPAQQATASNAASTPAQTLTTESSESMQESSSTWAQSIVRWVQYLAMIGLFGGFAFYLAVLVPVIRQVRTGVDSSNKDIVRFSEQRILLFLWFSVALLFIASLIALVQQAASVFDKPIADALSPSVLGQVLTKTGYGGAWILQIVATAAFPIILLFLGIRTKSGRIENKILWWIGLLIGAVLLLAPSWTGHTKAAANDFRLAVFADWLHIVAGGFWVGGLFHLALTGLPARSRLDSTSRGYYIDRIIRRFTQVAIPSVGVLVIAGSYNTWIHVESLRAFWSTSYGRTLLIKLALVGIMLVLGGLNTFHFGKKVGQVYQADTSRLQTLERGFRRSVSTEAVIGVVVLFVTAVLVFLTPPRSHPQVAKNGTQIIEQRR
jgi:copper transport protein